MLKATWTGTLSLVVAASIVLQVLAPAAGAVAIVSGFGLVACGTVVMARLSHSAGAFAVLKAAILSLRSGRTELEANMQAFFRAASFFRNGNIWPAEEAARRISRPVLLRGTQLVLDGFGRSQLAIALQRQIADERERLALPVELARAMAGYAPTLGMLGTLLGLVQMLFGAGSGDLGEMSSAMGFAMITTVYGLVLANLILKPIALKIEQRNRDELGRSLIDLQAVLLLYERQHPEYIRAVLNGSAQTAPRAGAFAAAVA